MYPLTIIHLVVAAVGVIGVLGHPGAADTAPAVRFWEAALPGTPIPEVIADLVQKGIDHSPLVEHYPVSDIGTVAAVTINYHLPPASEKRAQAPSRKNKIDYSWSLGPENAMSFFREKQVRVGTTMSLSFAPQQVPPILPRDVAEGVPFGDPASVLMTFHIAPSSAEAAMVRDTLSKCQELPIDPEQKACTTSLEGTVQSAMHMLGKDNNGAQLWAAAPTLHSTGLPLQSYTIQAVTPLDGNRHVGCHAMPYPYAVYYCHMTGLPTKAYLVSVHSDNSGGPAVTMVVMCHLDTSNWDPTHPAFKVLHTQPGGVPVCHFMSYANLLFGVKAVAGNP